MVRNSEGLKSAPCAQKVKVHSSSGCTFTPVSATLWFLPYFYSCHCAHVQHSTQTGVQGELMLMELLLHHLHRPLSCRVARTTCKLHFTHFTVAGCYFSRWWASRGRGSWGACCARGRIWISMSNLAAKLRRRLSGMSAAPSARSSWLVPGKCCCETWTPGRSSHRWVFLCCATLHMASETNISSMSAEGILSVNLCSLRHSWQKVSGEWIREVPRIRQWVSPARGCDVMPGAKCVTEQQKCQFT